MTWYDAWTYFLSTMGIFCFILLGNKNRYGFILGVILQALWVIFALGTEQYGFLVGAIFYAAVHIRGWIKWSRKPEVETEVRP